MLRRIGFEYAEQIDPFDGGPHFVAKTDDITIVRDAAEVAVRATTAAASRAWAIVGVETPGAQPQFRAIGARVTPHRAAVSSASPTMRAACSAIEDGQKVWLCYG